MAMGLLAAALAGTANASCFDEVTDRLNDGPLDFTAKSSDEVAFRFLSEWVKEYKSCLPLERGEFRMVDMIPTPDRAVVYVFEYVGEEELGRDKSTRQEIWSSMHQTYCSEERMSFRGVRLIYSIHDLLRNETLKLEMSPDACRVETV